MDFTEASQKGEQMAGSLTKAKDKALLFGKALKGGVDPGSESFKKLNWQSKLFVERVTGVKQILKGSFDPDSAGFSKFNKSSKEFLLNLDRIKRRQSIHEQHSRIFQKRLARQSKVFREKRGIFYLIIRKKS